jgi:hypothetical protein
MMKGSVSRGVALVSSLFVIAMVLYSCGQGSSTPGETGSVAVMVTDSPTAEFSKVEVTISSVELLSNTKTVTAFSGTQDLNLLDLENETALMTLAEGIPAGTYNKIRLRVTGVKLYDLDGALITSPPVKIAGDGKLDLTPRGPFTVEPGETLALRLDFDARKSLKLDETKNQYIFRPVIFVDATITGAPPSPSAMTEKLVRVTGTASKIDGVQGTFELLLAGGGTPVAVAVPEGASIFSEYLYGNSASFDAIDEGSAVTVVGMMVAGGAVEASVVEIGGFTKLSGSILSGIDPATGQFSFQPDPGQAAGDFPYNVIFQADTAIYSAAGEVLDASAITGGVKAEIDGIMLPVDLGPPLINAALVSLGTVAAAQSQALSGTVSAAALSSSDAPCLSYTDVDVVLITSSVDMATIEHVVLGDLYVGEQVDMYGSFDPVSGCFSVGTAVVERGT